MPQPRQWVILDASAGITKIEASKLWEQHPRPERQGIPQLVQTQQTKVGFALAKGGIQLLISTSRLQMTNDVQSNALIVVLQRRGTQEAAMCVALAITGATAASAVAASAAAAAAAMLVEPGYCCHCLSVQWG